MGKKLYVGNLSYDVDTDTLTAWFSAHGTVESAHIVNDRETNQSRGYGFVEMVLESEGTAAIAGLGGYARRHLLAKCGSRFQFAGE